MNILPEKVFVGLDYHLNSVQVCVLDSAGNQLINGTRPNNVEAVASVVPAGVEVEAAIESCCGAADFAEKLMEHAGWSVNLAHARYVARMKQTPDKSDFTDARTLADLIRVGYLPRVWLAPLPTRELRRTVRLRQQIVADRKKEKLRCSAILRDLRVKNPAGNRTWSKPWREWIAQVELPEASRFAMDLHLKKIANYNDELKLVEGRLKQMIEGDSLSQWLLSQTGIGLVTAVTLRAEIGRFERFRNGKQLARFCGVTPRNASSGDKQADGGLVRTANRELRRVLIEAAHRLKNYEDRWALLAQRMKDRGKAPGVITAAIANRWIRGLFYEARRAAEAGYKTAA